MVLPDNAYGAIIMTQSHPNSVCPSVRE